MTQMLLGGGVTDFLIEKEKEEQLKENPELMYDDTDDRNLRYVGADPHNYIDIGDRDSAGNKILWRIIGVMNNVTSLDNGEKSESLVKIIRADSIGEYSWDSSAPEINKGNGVNEWSQADIMKLLNPESLYTKDGEIGNSLYWNNESGRCYNGNSNADITCNFTSSGISEDAKNKIAKVRWNTGTFATYDTSEWTASATYKAERSIHNGKEYCINEGGGNNCNDEVPRTTTWDGYIGLIHPSDYGYAVGKNVRKVCLATNMFSYNNVNNCGTNDWLKTSSGFYWALNPIATSDGATWVFGTYSEMGNVFPGQAFGACGIRPVAYLKSSITISDALGTPDDPFVAS